jgi:hypothetical protein
MRTVCLAHSARIVRRLASALRRFSGSVPGETPAWPSDDRLLWHYCCESPQRFQCFRSTIIIQSPGRRGAPTAEDIVTALKAICARRAVEAA